MNTKFIEEIEDGYITHENVRQAAAWLHATNDTRLTTRTPGVFYWQINKHIKCTFTVMDSGAIGGIQVVFSPSDEGFSVWL